ncbi:hypothetical protein A3A75_05335 [Candidatus Woesebacteria bacterium RIFCSPLOWO2_01_FULL_39_10]|uniref:DUF4181 domain-containing protein n=1 Tax=Candidatus Woesebacteria bacterium RIFCSPLOWO2_01_FULL_39_10 TaxID=1802516 RepID=A0A1F8B4Y1_9BACT|nr:MAG: hypothetical protein A3A75_05335 [Candidatus Woesebacteria bacterium RIFCSPLOWO2_01_FULL_39_10]
MSNELLYLSFAIIFLYGGLREFFRIRRKPDGWLNKLPVDRLLLYILGRSAFIFAGFTLIQLESSNLNAPIETWRKIYLYMSIIIADEMGSYIYSKTKIELKEYALAAMLPGFLVIVIFFFLQILIVSFQ